MEHAVRVDSAHFGGIEAQTLTNHWDVHIPRLPFNDASRELQRALSATALQKAAGESAVR
jgi:hypothetical protein